MDIKAILAARGRDGRIDLFRGLANWFIFVDHIPHNVVSLFTIRNFGFSGATDIFRFVAGYAASITYARRMLERGCMVGRTLGSTRCWQLYVCEIACVTVYVATLIDG